MHKQHTLYINIIRSRENPIYTASEDGRTFASREDAIGDIITRCMAESDGKIMDGDFYYEFTLVVDLTDTKAQPKRISLWKAAENCCLDEAAESQGWADHIRSESRGDLFV